MLQKTAPDCNFRIFSYYLVNPCPAEPVFANSVDPDQVASEAANWSGSALFVNQYVNLYQQSGLSNLIGWQLKMSVASYSA